jgi:hypothetical protein
MAYAECRERKKGVRYRGMYKAADGRYRSAGTFSTEERALAVALEAERHAAELVGGAAAGLDPITRATRTIAEYAPLFLRHHQVEGNTKDTYADTLRLHVIPFLGGCRLSETDRTVARTYVTALQEEGRSANTIRQAKVVLGAMFGMAVADGYLDYNQARSGLFDATGVQRAAVLRSDRAAARRLRLSGGHPGGGPVSG